MIYRSIFIGIKKNMQAFFYNKGVGDNIFLPIPKSQRVISGRITSIILDSVYGSEKLFVLHNAGFGQDSSFLPGWRIIPIYVGGFQDGVAAVWKDEQCISYNLHKKCSIGFAA